MCHEFFTRRARKRHEDERFDEEELRYLLDEHEMSEPPRPVVEHEPVEEAEKAERVEA